MDTTGWPGSSTPRTRVRIGLVLAVIGIMVVVPTAVWASHAFSDVPDTDWAHDEIAWLAEKELTHGCEDGTMFCPDDFVSRRELAVITHREHQNLDVRHEPVNKAVVLAAGIDTRVATVQITAPLDGGFVSVSGFSMIAQAAAPVNGFLWIEVDNAGACDRAGVIAMANYNTAVSAMDTTFALGGFYPPAGTSRVDLCASGNANGANVYGYLDATWYPVNGAGEDFSSAGALGIGGFGAFDLDTLEQSTVTNP